MMLVYIKVHCLPVLYKTQFYVCLVAFTEVYNFSVMILDGKMFYFTCAATIRHLLKVLQIGVNYFDACLALKFSVIMPDGETFHFTVLLS
jgi:hypothetical protein